MAGTVSAGDIEMVLRLSDLLTPALNQAVNNIKQQESKGNALAQGIGQGIGQKLAEGIMKAAGAIAASFAHIVEEADKLTNISQATGASVEGLQKLEFAGKAVGLSLEDIGGAVEKMQRAIANGGDAANAAFAKIGTSASALKQMAPEQQLETIVMGLQKIQDPAQRTALAMELLGRSGAKLIPLGSGLKEATAAAERLGIVMSANTVKNADDLGDAIGALGAVFDGLMNNLGAVFTNSNAAHDAIAGLTEIFGNMSKGVKDNESVLRTLVENGIFIALKALQIFMVLVAGTIQALSNLAQAYYLTQSAILGFAQGYYTLKAAVQSYTGFAKEAQENRDMASSLQSQRDELSKTADEIQQKYQAVGDVAALASVQIGDLADSIGTGARAAGAAAPTHKAAADSLKAAAEAAKTYETESNKLAEELVKVSSAGAATLNHWDQERAAVSADTFAYIAHVEQLKITQAQREALIAQSGKLAGAKMSGIDNKQAAAQAENYEKELQKLEQELAKVANVGENSFDKLRNDAGISMKSQIAGFEELRKNGDLTEEGFRKLSATAEQLKTATVNAIGSDQAQQQAETYTGHLRDLDTAIMDATGHSGDYANVQASIVASAGAAADALDKEGKEGKLTADQVERLKKKLEELVNAQMKQAATAHLMHIADEFSKAGTALGALNSLMQEFGINSESSIGKAVQGLQGLAGAASEGMKAFATFKTDPLGAIIHGINAVKGAVGALKKLFGGKSEIEKIGEEAGKTLGMSVSKELASTIQKTSKDLKISIPDAALLNLDKAMEESGKSVHDMSEQVMKLFTLDFPAGSKAAQQQMEQLDSAFQKVRESSTGVGDAMTVAMLKAAEATGHMTESMKQFVSEQQDLAINGAKKIAEGLKMIKPEDLKEFGNFGPVAADFFAQGFQDSIAKNGLLATITDMGDQLVDVFARVSETGFSFSAAGVLEPFVKLKEVLDEDDGKLKGMITVVEGMGDVFESTANRGLFDPAMQAGFGDALMHTFDALKTATGDAHTSMLAILPDLTKSIQAAQNLGVPLDENTAKLKAQAEEMGYAFPVDPMVKMVDLLTAIAQKMGADIPDSVKSTTEALDAVAPSADGAGEAILTIGDKANDAAGMVDGAMGDAAAAITGEIPPAVDEAAGSLQTALVEGAEQAAAGMTDTLEGAAGDLEAILANIDVGMINVPYSFEQVGPDLPDGGSTGGGGGNNPHVPHYAEGARNLTHPHLAIVGDNPYGEDIVPRTRRAQSEYMHDIAGASAGGGEQTVNVNLIADGEKIAKVIIRRNRAGLFTVEQ